MTHRANRFFAILGGVALLTLLAGCSKPAAPEPEAGEPVDFIRLLNVGKSQYDKGDAAEAAETFQTAVSANPTSIDARLNLANALLLADRPDAVLEHVNYVLASDSGNAAAHYLKGCAHLRLQQFEPALQALQQAKDIDRTVNEVSFQLGIAHEGLGQTDAAIAQWRETIQFGPDHPAAYYRLAQLLIRTGNPDEGAELLEKHQEVVAGRTLGADVATFERSVYTRIRVPFVLEQPDPTGVQVAFVDVTADWLPAAAELGGPIARIDFRQSGRPGLLALEEGRRLRLLEHTNGVFEFAGNTVNLGADGDYRRILVGDLDNDRFEDAVVLGANRVHLLKFAAEGRMIDRTLLTGLAGASAIDGVLADLDVTGKLDLALVGDGFEIYRNGGNFTFRPDTAAFEITNTVDVTGVHAGDFNHDDLTDLVLRSSAATAWLANERGGTFANTNAPAAVNESRQVDVADFNNDLIPDVLSLSADSIDLHFGGLANGISLALNGVNTAGFKVVDYDNDGWLDVLALGDGVRLWRNLGVEGFRDVTAETGLEAMTIGAVREVLAFDVDGDCDLDLVLSGDNGLTVLRNDGGNANHLLTIRPVGNRSNASGIGARFELASSNWRTMRTVDQSPLQIGVGDNDQIDSLVAQWTQIRMNLDSVSTADCRAVSIIEQEQKQITSCPYLYAWDGTTFRFVTDLLGAAPVGLPVAPGRFIEADPEEIVWIGDERMFPARDGRFVIQITEELSEMLYLDEVKLIAVDHPAGTEVHPTTKLLPGGPFPPHELVTLQNRVPLRAAVNHVGTDVTEALRRVDDVRVSPTDLLGPQLRGHAEPYYVDLDFGPLAVEKPLALAMTGWLRFGGAMANIAASHHADMPFPFPVLEARLPDGTWTPVDVTVGAPVGKTKTIVVDLTNRLPAGADRLRLSATFEIHWDRIALFEKSPGTAAREKWLSPVATDLHWRGFSEDADLDWTFPITPIYDQVKQLPPWRIMPTGYCTAYGAVDELVAEKDNGLVLINGGDELTVEFDADELGDVPEGFVRNFYLWSVGWDKDTDYHVTLGEHVGPLPWHGMDDQAYGREERPEFPSDEMMRRHNTRWVGPEALPRREISRAR